MEKRKSILVLTTTYPRWLGDTEPAFVHNLSAQLAQRYEVHVLAPLAKGAKKYECMDGVHVHRFRYLPFYWQSLCYDGGIIPKLKEQPWRIIEAPFLMLFMLLNSLFLLRKYSITLVHAHWLIPQGFLAILLAKLSLGKVKVLVTSHGADLYALKNPVLQRLKRWVINKSDTACVVSSAMQKYCEQDLKVSKPLTVAPMGVDCQNIFVDNTPFDQRNGIVFVGRLVEKKGLNYLLPAFALLLKQYPRETLTIVGEGAEKAALQDWVKQQKLEASIHFIGAVSADKVAEYFNQAKIAVMPSVTAKSGDQEGLGLVAAEALASGCITLVSKIAAIQDVHNQALLQFSPADVQSLYQTLCFVKQQPEQAWQLTQQIKTHVQTHYDWQAVGRHYIQLIDQL